MTEDEQNMCDAYLVDTGNIDPDAGDVENRQGVLATTTLPAAVMHRRECRRLEEST